MSARYFSLTFPPNLVREPVIYSLVEKYGLEPVVYQASVISSSGWMAISLDGPKERVDAAITDIKCRGAWVREGGKSLVEEEGPSPAPGVRVRLTIPAEKIREPLYGRIIKGCGVAVNIRHARITHGEGTVDMEITGEPGSIDAAMDVLKKMGISVDPIERNVIE
jgi:hypothetical protein